MSRSRHESPALTGANSPGQQGHGLQIGDSKYYESMTDWVGVTASLWKGNLSLGFSSVSCLAHKRAAFLNKVGLLE